MTAFPNPTKQQILDAFKAHGLKFKVEPIVASSEGRGGWYQGLRALIDHHTAGSNSLSLLMNKGGTYPLVNSLIDKDGLVHILSTQSCWGTGNGGPWSGIAAKDSLHLVGWSTEVEDLGQGKTFTNAQLESLGRQNAALVSLGVPAKNEINHRDWTDGTNGVGGYPLPTTGRKIDTRYDTPFLRENTAKYFGDDVALSDEDVEKIWNKKMKTTWDGTQKAAKDVLLQAHYYALFGGLIGTVPEGAAGNAGRPTSAKRIFDESVNDGSGNAGTIALSDADKADIAKRVADEIYARMKQ